MKRIFTTLYALAAVALTVAAQPRFTSNTEMYNFGQIEWKHPVSVQYTITNTGDQPLVLTEVEPDCACSVAQWTKTPIAPGAKGFVDVTFDAEALGHFHKSVAIYSNAEPHLVYLKFSGEVVQEIKDFTKLIRTSSDKFVSTRTALTSRMCSPATNRLYTSVW